MSIASVLTRLAAAKTAIANAITAKGGTVAQGDGFENFATDIASIPSGGAVDYLASYFNNTITEYEFPDGTSAVPQGAFNNKSTFQKLTLPTSVTSVATYALGANASNFEIHFKGTSEEWSSISMAANWTLNTAYILYANNSLVTEAVFSAGKTSTSVNYNRCTSITSATLPTTITSVDANAFSYCTNLASINFPSGLTSIGNSAFIQTKLTTVKIPGTVTGISQFAFYQTNTITRIDCTELTATGGTVDTALTGIFAFPANSAPIVFATQAIRDVYASATNWSNYASRMTWEGA